MDNAVLCFALVDSQFSRLQAKDQEIANLRKSTLSKHRR